jgi:uncharacterized protein (TIGR02145 family)
MQFLFLVTIITGASLILKSCTKEDNLIEYGIVTDIDGNSYKTVKIGSQCWMAENLKTTRFNDGMDIPVVKDGSVWAALSTSGYCWFMNDEVTNKTTYGGLYNWHTVSSGNLCPTGWHVPTNQEWNILIDYLIANGYNYDGTTTDNKIAKSLASTSEWRKSGGIGTPGSADHPANTNKSGFTALPGSCRYYDGTFPIYGIGGGCMMWSSTEHSAELAYYFGMGYGSCAVQTIYYYKKEGYSVRCLLD